MSRLFAGTPFDRPPHCERCERPESECTCPPIEPPSKSIPPEKQTARLQAERRKKGKIVTVVRGLSAEGNNLPDLLTRAKNHCGAGGTVHEDGFEIQGDHVDRLIAWLGQLGYRTKR
jgi:translation initiation factor 1